MERHAHDAGLLASLRDLGESLVGSARDRVQLLAVELQEEKFRLIQIFIWISAVIFTGMMAVFFLSITVVYLFWESARVYALAGLTFLYCGSFVALLLAFKSFVKKQPLPFAATVEELTEDRSCFQTEN